MKNTYGIWKINRKYGLLCDWDGRISYLLAGFGTNNATATMANLCAHKGFLRPQFKQVMPVGNES